MEKANLMPAHDRVGTFILETGKEALDSFVTESLDLISALFPSVAIWSYGAELSAELTGRIRAFGVSDVDVYSANVREPIVSSNRFSPKSALICPGEIDELSLKRALFDLGGLEGTTQRILHISSLIFVGCIATFGSAPLLATIAYVPLGTIASAYTYDTLFLEAFPEEKEALLKKREEELHPPAADTRTLSDLSANALFYAWEYLPAMIKRDVVASYEVERPPVIEPEPSIEEIEEAEETIIEPVSEPTSEPTEEVTLDPGKDPSKRGGHQGR